MENSKKWLVYVLVVAAALGGGYFYLKVQPPGAEAPTASVALASFTNARGEPWSIPTGKYEFTVSADRNIRPSFLWGEIDPLKVQPGDTQRLKVIVGDTVGIKSVTAEFETDTRRWSIPLKLTGTEARAPKEIAMVEAKYTVENGNLIINDDVVVARAVESGIIPSAGAQEMLRYIYEGEWLVEDTHRETYHTIFTAENEQGDKNTLVMAWSDPCNFIGGQLQQDCSFATGVDGVDNGAMNLQSFTMTLATGTATLAFNPGQTLTLGTGKIVIHPGSKVEQKYLYYGDADQDRYATSVAYIVDASAGPQLGGNKTRVYYTLGTNDCDDFNGNTFPGQTSWFTTAIVDTGGTSNRNGTYDYNCDGFDLNGYGGGGYQYAQYQSMFDTTGGSAAKSACMYSVPVCASNVDSNPAVGWSADWPFQSTIPGCGVTGEYVTTFNDCSSYLGSEALCNSAGLTTFTQGCR